MQNKQNKLLLGNWHLVVSFMQDIKSDDYTLESLSISTKYPHVFSEIRFFIYSIYCMYSDRKARANSVDPDEMPQNVASHLGLHCLPLIQQFLDAKSSSKLYLFKF